MPRVLFEKKGNGVWISHLDTMRLFQRAFKRSGLALTHSQGFNPRPTVSIALPLSVGVESRCELLDFELEGQDVPMEEIRDKLNMALPAGVRVLEVYEDGRKTKQIALLDCMVTLEYDGGVPEDALEKLRTLFDRSEILVEKKAKSGKIKDQNISELIRKLEIQQLDNNIICITARICCQDPALNPMQLVVAIQKYLPELKPDFSKCARLEIYDEQESIFR